ncbi:MAG: metal ABC transporter permease [Phycisphaerales bacterium]|nr:metal ABC transporter permease [Phycisphaerales bacterium]
MELLAISPPVISPAQLELWAWLTDETQRQILLPALAAGLPVIIMCAVLSVLVVIKRLAFVGQGVAHSAFGGVGVAAMFAAFTGVSWAAQGSAFELGIVVTFCILAAIGMSSVSDRKAVQVDTGIGLFLVASMALGALLVEAARSVASSRGHPVGARSWESVLFGSIMTANWSDAMLAAGAALVVLLAVFIIRRPLLFYISDETSARAFGVPTGAMRVALMIMLAIATVVAMRLTGVVLSSALLILPGAAALKISRRLVPVVLLAISLGVAALFVGVGVSLQFNWSAGPCVVLTLTMFFIAGALGHRIATIRTQPPGDTPSTRAPVAS